MIWTLTAAAALTGQPIDCPVAGLTPEQRIDAGYRLGKLAADLPGGDSDAAKLAAAAFERAADVCKAEFGWTSTQADAALNRNSALMVIERLKQLYGARQINLSRLDPVLDRLFANPEAADRASAVEGMENILRAQGMTKRDDDPKALVMLYAGLRDLARRAEQDFVTP